MAFKRDKLKTVGVAMLLMNCAMMITTIFVLIFSVYKICKINVLYERVEQQSMAGAYSPQDKLTIEELKKEIDILNVRNRYLEESVDKLSKKKKAEEKQIKESASSKKKSVKPVKTDKIQQRELSAYWYAYDRARIKRKHYMAESHLQHLLTILSSRKHKVDPHVILAIYELESNFQYNIKTKGGSGYGQLIYSTGKWRYERVLKLGEYKREYALDPIINITITADYFAWLVGKYKGDLHKAMKEYSGHAIGSRYQELVDKRLRKNTGKGLEDYNSISKINYTNGGNKK